MRLRFHWKMLVHFILLSLLLFAVQGYLRFFLKASWFLSSLFALLSAGFVAYFLFRHLAYPIQRMTEVVRGLTGNHQSEGGLSRR